MYHIGQRFSNGNHYILAKTGQHQVALISLDTGTMWSNSVYVSDEGDISESEFKEVCDGDEFYGINKDGDFGELSDDSEPYLPL